MGRRHGPHSIPEVGFVQTEQARALADRPWFVLQQPPSPGFSRVEQPGIRIPHGLAASKEVPDGSGIDVAHEAADVLALAAHGLVARYPAGVLQCFPEAPG